MALPPVLAKQYGPFNGLTWIGVIAGGAVLAYFLRKAFSGGSRAPAEQVQDTRARLQLPGTTYRPDTSGPAGGADTEGDGGQIPSDTKTPAPRPSAPKPPKPYVGACPPGQQWNAQIKKCVPIPGYKVPKAPKPPAPPKVPAPPKPAPPKPAPKPPAPQKPGVHIPGNFPPGCSGVGPVPRDYMQRKGQSVAKNQGRSIKTAWAILNITGPAGSDINALHRWLATPGSWTTANSIRRSRGLQPLNDNQWAEVRRDIATIVERTAGKENKVTDADILGLWEKWNTPFLCANPPANSGSRANARIDQ